MKRITLSLLLLSSIFFTSAQAAEPVTTKQEIAHLFTVLETSGCEFNRNGTWYGAKDAAAHLRTKYKYLQDKDMVPSTEKFIERAATASSMSGTAYQIKCANAVAQPSSPWFQAVLAKYRNPAKAK